MRSAQERHRRHSSEKRRRRQSWGKRPTKHHWKIETHDKNAYPKGKVHVWGGRRDDAHGVTQNLCRVPQEVALKTRQRKRRRKVLGTYVSRAARAIPRGRRRVSLHHSERHTSFTHTLHRFSPTTCAVHSLIRELTLFLM